jgi:hypothetical protein
MYWHEICKLPVDGDLETLQDSKPVRLTDARRWPNGSRETGQVTLAVAT